MLYHSFSPSSYQLFIVSMVMHLPQLQILIRLGIIYFAFIWSSIKMLNKFLVLCLRMFSFCLLDCARISKTIHILWICEIEKSLFFQPLSSLLFLSPCKSRLQPLPPHPPGLVPTPPFLHSGQPCSLGTGFLHLIFPSFSFKTSLQALPSFLRLFIFYIIVDLQSSVNFCCDCFSVF